MADTNYWPIIGASLFGMTYYLLSATLNSFVHVAPCLPMLCVLFRKVEDLQFNLEEMSIEKAEAEVSSFYHVLINILVHAFML